MLQKSIVLLGLCLLLSCDNVFGLLDKLIKGGSNCDCPCRDYWTVKCTMEYETQCKPTYTSRECTKVPRHVPMKVKETECQKCVKYYETVLETKNKWECVKVYDEQCDTHYPAKCTTEQQCTMLYQTVCSTVGYAQKCSQVPKQKCTPITKCHRTPQTNCRPVQRQKCGKVPVKVPKRIQKHSCQPYDVRDSSSSHSPNCGSNDLSSGYGAPSSGYGAPSSGYNAPNSGYNSPAGSLEVPSQSLSSTQTGLNLTPDTIAGAPDTYGSPLAPPQGGIDSYGSPIGEPQVAPDSYGSPIGPAQGNIDSYGSPTGASQGAPDSYGSPISSSQSAFRSVGGSLSDTFDSPSSGADDLGAPDTYGSPLTGTFSSLGSGSGGFSGNQGAPDSYGTPLGSPLGSSIQSQGASDSYGSPQAIPNLYTSPNIEQQTDSYGSPAGSNTGFQLTPNSYGSPAIETPGLYVAPQGNQFRSNSESDGVSIATIKVVDPPGGSGNPFLSADTGTKPYKQVQQLLASQTQNVPSLPTNNRFTPEFIPSVRLPDNFVPDLGTMILHTTDRNILLNNINDEKKMKFPSGDDDGDIKDYSQANNLLRQQEIDEIKEDDKVEILTGSLDPSPDELEDDADEEEEDDYDDTDVERVPVSVGKMGKAAKEDLKLEEKEEVETTDPSKTQQDLDHKTLEKVLENILAEVEQTDSEEEENRQKLRRKKKRRIPTNIRHYGAKLKQKRKRNNS